MLSIEDQPYNPVDPGPVVNSTFSWWGLLGMVAIFLIILFISLLIIRSLKKSNLGSIDTKWIRVIDRQPLAGQQILYLVEIAGKLQVLGGSDHGIIKITEIDNPEVAAEILADIASRPYDAGGGGIPFLFDKISNLIRKKDFSKELEELMDRDGNYRDEE